MTLTPLDEQDLRLRQPSAALTKQQLRSREQQMEIESLLDFVHGVEEAGTAGVERDLVRPSTVGLSASQVGIMKQICIVDLSIGRQGYHDIYVLVNPEIVWRSKSTVERHEGCVNFTTTWGITRRSKSVRVRALDRSGNELELKLSGWPAVLMQHEMDHMIGHLFIDRLLDPAHAHRVEPEEFGEYRRSKPGEWQKYVDVTLKVQA